MDIVFLVCCVALLVISLLALLYRVAKADMHATYVETGGFKFKVLGETLVEIIDNVEGYYIDQNDRRLKKDDELGKRRPKGFLEKLLGMVWISLIWPLRESIHSFRVVADRIKNDPDINVNTLPTREQIRFEIRKTTYLRARFIHPVLVTDVELGKDRWKVDLMVKLDMMVVKPAVVVFDYKGTVAVMEQIDASVRAAVIDKCNDEGMDYTKFLSENKGANSPFAKLIMDLNKPRPTINVEAGGDSEILFKGIKEHFGVEIKAAWIESVDLSPEQKDLDDATRAVAQEKLLADAETEKARGKKAMAKAILEGQAEGLVSIAEKMKEKGFNISNEQMGRIIFEQVRTGNLAGANSKLTTYVEGGSHGGVVPTINVNQKEENR